MKPFKVTTRTGKTIFAQSEASTLRSAKAAATKLVKDSIPAQFGDNLYYAAAKEADIKNTETGETLAYIRLK